MPSLDPNDFADLDGWPYSWRFTSRDLRTGQRLLDLFKPFLFYLGVSGITARTFRRHVDNLWLLGGELIRYAQNDTRFMRSPEVVLLEFGERWMGPVLLHESPRTQAEVDVTFRALIRFLRAARSSGAPRRKAPLRP
jgi:hypothetical protein